MAGLFRLNCDEPSLVTADAYVRYITAAHMLAPLEVPPLCFLVYSDRVVEAAVRRWPHTRLDIGSRRPTHVFIARTPERSFGIVAPQYGPAMAAVALEELIALGFRSFVSLGTVGAIRSAGEAWPRIGDTLLPVEALRYEGTSDHYLPRRAKATASTRLVRVLARAFARAEHPVTTCVVATTGALYRETRSMLTEALRHGAIAVDMETAALFAVGQRRGVEVASVLYVSDVIVLDPAPSNAPWELRCASREVGRVEAAAFDVLVSIVGALATGDREARPARRRGGARAEAKGGPRS